MKKISLILCLAVLLSELTGCAGWKRASGAGEVAPKDPLLRTDFVCEDNSRVFYEIFVGSFSDSNGDGTGDLRGILNRMDYLNDGRPDSGRSLGIEGIWLTPVFRSPSYHKYDVEDYYTVDPDFGTLEDLRELFALCRERNVKVILDLPINHTSARCEWFRRFCEAHRSGDAGNAYYDFYSWVPEGSGTEGRVFQPIPGCSDLYECNFTGDMPELNFDSAFVRETLLDVARFWLEQGADGFRFDAAKYVYLGEDRRSADFWNWYLRELRKLRPEIYTVAEVWDGDAVTDAYYPATDCFNFTLGSPDGLLAAAARGGDADRLTFYMQDYLDRVRRIRPSAMPVLFLSNHDQDRSAGVLSASDGAVRMAANLYLLGPGSPFIYYGEELGMLGARGPENSDANRRLAMPWGDGDTVRNPAGSTWGESVDADAAAQRKDPDSLYNYYKKLLLIRRANPEIARGVYRAVRVPGGRLSGFTALWGGSAVCVLHNVGDAEVTVDLRELGMGWTVLRAAAGMNGARLEGTILTVGAKTSVVLK